MHHQEDSEKFIFVQSPFVILFQIPGLAFYHAQNFYFWMNGNMKAFPNKRTYFVG